MKTLSSLSVLILLTLILAGCKSSPEGRRHSHPTNVHHLSAPTHHHRLPPAP